MLKMCDNLLSKSYNPYTIINPSVNKKRFIKIPYITKTLINKHKIKSISTKTIVFLEKDI